MTVWRLISLGAIGMSAFWFGATSSSAATTSGSMRSDSGEIAFASRRDGNWEI